MLFSTVRSLLIAPLLFGVLTGCADLSLRDMIDIADKVVPEECDPEVEDCDGADN